MGGGRRESACFYRSTPRPIRHSHGIIIHRPDFQSFQNPLLFNMSASVPPPRLLAFFRRAVASRLTPGADLRLRAACSSWSFRKRSSLPFSLMAGVVTSVRRAAAAEAVWAIGSTGVPGAIGVSLLMKVEGTFSSYLSNQRFVLH